MGKKLKRLFSGIQPTGEIHIGNYQGAIKQWVKLIDKYECFYCIVDYHAITIEYNVREMPDKILKTAVCLIACGLNPEKCVLFVQSHVPEHTELAWVLNTVTAIGDLQRMTQFKEKSQQHKGNVNVGLFTYPVLQAADIILYKADVVPVGEDQFQHVELSRRIARKFNALYGKTFPEPQHLSTESPRIIGLDGQYKMSKSRNNYIGILESDEIIWEKISRAVTDPARKTKKDPGNPEICNMYSLHKLYSSREEIENSAENCKKASWGCLDCKRILWKNIVESLKPIKQKANELENNIDYVHNILKENADKSRKIAKETMNEVREKLGILI
ncbi:tryptophan--tRNA ligase [candidate division KSB1 bacterium]|nr:MAG: tryptophan--tRNA ligase [candidate division KSB1 bacterium]